VAAGLRAAESSTPEAQRASAPGAEPFAPDYLLAQRAAQSDVRAQRQIALRLVGRIRRAAHALMGGAAEADDAAHHALIEVLRSLGAYAGSSGLEAWADRISARGIVRFARAVRARAGVASVPPETDPALAPQPAGECPERFARTLEEFLRQLPSAPREALLLREVFGFDVVQTSQLLRLSTSALRDQLARARRSLFERSQHEGRTQPTESAAPASLSESVARWFALRDAGEARPDSRVSEIPGASPKQGDVQQTVDPRGSAREQSQEEKARLAEDEDVRKLQRGLRALSQVLEAGRLNRPGAREKKLVEGALLAVRVSSVSPTRSSSRSERERSAPREADASQWVQPISLMLCVLLVVGAFVALAVYQPGQRPGRAQHVPRSSPDAVVNPTVEALSTAHSIDPRARLRRAGKPMGEGTQMREGDIVAASTRPACVRLTPPADVCLSPGSEARIARLGVAERSVELLNGRAVVSVERALTHPGASAGRIPFAIVVGALRAEVLDADFGVEIDTDMVVVRALRGTLVLSADGDTRVLNTAHSAIYRWHQRSLEVSPQLLEKARRDWDLLAARNARPTGERGALARGTFQAAPARDARASLAEPSGPALPPESAPLEPPEEPEAPPFPDMEETPEALLEQAKQLARERLWAEAEQLYELIAARFPQHAAMREALVLQGELLAERLQRPADALSAFERYLSSGGGPLDLRARYGRIVALRKLDRSDEERAAVAQFLNLYRSTPQARVLLSAAEPGVEQPASASESGAP
jgi:RNA polymerase sigma-70 factor, ECF subfamily